MIMLDITAFQNVNISTDDIAGETNPVPLLVDVDVDITMYLIWCGLGKFYEYPVLYMSN